MLAQTNVNTSLIKAPGLESDRTNFDNEDEINSVVEFVVILSSQWVTTINIIKIIVSLAIFDIIPVSKRKCTTIIENLCKI